MEQMDNGWNPKSIHAEGTTYNQQGCQWIKQSRSRVRNDIIAKSFKKCGISDALDGSEDHFIYEEDNVDIEEEEEEGEKEESLDDYFQGF